MMYSLPYGKVEIFFKIPEGFKLTIAEPKLKSSVDNVNAATKKALLHPINSRKLSETVSGKRTACIVVTDITRACPDKELLPPLLEEIEKGVSRNNITILIASGMHREMSHEEML